MKRIAVLSAAAVLILSTSAMAAPGDPDPSFDGDGIRIIDFGGTDSAQAVLVQPDGKLVVAGHGAGSPVDFLVSRFNLDGSLDTSYSGDGKTAVDFGGIDLYSTDNATAAALQPDGKLVEAGHTSLGGNLNFAVMRLTSGGSLDPTFDGDGRLTIDYGGSDRANDVLLQPDGKIVIAGTIFNNTFLVLRLNPDGSSDSSFSGFGQKTVGFGGDARGNSVALQPDGKIVAAGYMTGTAGDANMAVARLNPDGSLDSTFDGDGRRTIDLGGDDSARDVLVQPDGKILLTGRGEPNGNVTVTRLDPDGSLDTSFAGGGTFAVDFGDEGAGSEAALQTNGKIVVVGSGGTPRPFLLRLQPGGSRDTTFSSDGEQSLPVPGSGNSVALLRDGRIAAAGYAREPGNLNVLVALVEGGDAGRDGGSPGGGGGGGGGGSAGVPRCAGKKATIVGSRRPERLKGTRRADVIVALGGNDRIDAGRGNDLVCAGDGNDKIKGSTGNDRLYGQNGSDRLYGQNGKDRLAGGNGKDALSGGGDRDRLAGGTGRDSCTGGAGKDRANCERKKGL